MDTEALRRALAGGGQWIYYDPSGKAEWLQVSFQRRPIQRVRQALLAAVGAILLIMLAGCGSGETRGQVQASENEREASTPLDDWAAAVVAGDFSTAEGLMQANWSWKEDTTHWYSGRGGMSGYQVVEGPTPAGESQSYTIKWLWNEGHVPSCLNVQVGTDNKIKVIGDYKRCPDSPMPAH